MPRKRHRERIVFFVPERDRPAMETALKIYRDAGISEATVLRAAMKILIQQAPDATEVKEIDKGSNGGGTDGKE